MLFKLVVRANTETKKKLFFSIWVILCFVLSWNTNSPQINVKSGSLPVEPDIGVNATPVGWHFKTPFPVHVVYTWVNGSDPKFIEQLESLKNELQMTNSYSLTKAKNLGNNRFADNDALRFSLRSLETYANWVRHVFIVTNGQIPTWLNLSNPRVTVVTHQDIFDEPEYLPTFSSRAIQHNVHKIKGLSERFIHLNDDFFFGRKVSLDDFYTDRKGTKVYLSWDAYTKCGEKCNITLIRNGMCDDVCNYDHCAWDGGDCDDVPMKTRPKDVHKAHCDYSVSILFTNAILSKVFGYKQRKVLEHAPMFMEKGVKRDLDERFSKEIKETIRRKMRSPLDVQFELSYTSFLMEAYNKSKRFELEINSPDVKFVVVNSNSKLMQRDLRYLKTARRKFFCLNDNINYSDPNGAEKTSKLLKEFYEFMFPNPSSFEIQP